MAKVQLSVYFCRSESDLRRLHARIYRWLPGTGGRRRMARETAQWALPIVEDLIAHFGQIGSPGYEAQTAARLNLEYEIDDIRIALDSLHLDLKELSDTGLLAEELDEEEEWEDEEEE